MDKRKILVKNTNVKLIFEKMDYGQVVENTNVAKAWLQEHHREVCSYVNKKSEFSKGTSIAIKDVNTGENMSAVFSPLKSDVEKIILNAKQNTVWFCKTAEEKTVLINRLAEEIQNNSNLICQLEISLRGILSVDTKTKAIPLLVDYLQYYSSWAAKTLPLIGDHLHSKTLADVTTGEGGTEIVPSKIGVAVSFIDDNSFVGFLGCILGPALAAGYNLLIQAAPKISPLVLLIIELAESIGIPEGTLKLIPGKVDDDAIFQNENVAVITSFGSSSSNIRIPIRTNFCAITDSKSSMIIFNSADIDAACDSVMNAAWSYQGLLPWSVNTLLVQEDIFQSVIEKLKYKLSKIKMSVATDKTADLSCPIDVNANKQLNVLINEAKLQGIEVFKDSEKTDVFQPTLLVGGRVFGNNVIRDDDKTAVVTVLAFRTASEATNLANNSRYGFGASVWTENIGLANEVARNLNVSNVWINSHGLFDASIAFSPYKKSGYGIFGGSQGFEEFITCTTNKSTSVFDIKSLKIYESGTVKDVYKCPVGNDFHNIVMLAKKGYQSWSKLTLSFRSQFLRKVANKMSNNIQLSTTLESDQRDIGWLIQLFYLLPISVNSGSTSYTHSTYNIQSYYDPIGVVIIEAPKFIEQNFVQTILGSIMLGNAVIVLCFSHVSTVFCQELSKFMSQCNITPGVFSVVSNCNENVIKAALSDREVDLYIDHNETNIKPKLEHMQRFYSGKMSWKQILNHVTLIKNVWFNIGDSIA